MKRYLATIIIFSLQTAFAYESKPTYRKLVQAAKTFDFNGIVKTDQCSGALVHFSGQPQSHFGYVLTNGHCLKRKKMMPANLSISNKNNRLKMKVYSKDLRAIKIRATKLIFATMDDTDVALYKINMTYTQLANLGVDSFELGTQRPNIFDQVDIVSGFWNRGYQCEIKRFIYKIREGKYTWYDSLALASNDCNIVDGVSGSPIITRGRRLIVAIINSGNEDGRLCTQENPCEVDTFGNRIIDKSVSYGQQTYQIYSCLSLDFQINLDLVGCQLSNKTR
jgi:V8-like Glu-specific endopeptidase